MIVLKELMAKGINYLKVMSKVITSLSVEKCLYGQPVDSDIKQYKEIRMSTTGKDEDYTTRCFFLDFVFIKNHHRLIAVNLSKQKYRC